MCVCERERDREKERKRESTLASECVCVCLSVCHWLVKLLCRLDQCVRVCVCVCVCVCAWVCITDWCVSLTSMCVCVPGVWLWGDCCGAVSVGGGLCVSAMPCWAAAHQGERLLLLYLSLAPSYFSPSTSLSLPLSLSLSYSFYPTSLHFPLSTALCPPIPPPSQSAHLLDSLSLASSIRCQQNRILDT